MTSKEKAKELVDKYSTYVVMWAGGIETSKQNVKQCALITVQELMDFNCYMMPEVKESMMDYLNEVKQEIEKL